MRKALLLATGAALTAGLTAAIATAAVSEPFLLKGGEPNQQNPAATAEWFAWTQAPADHPNRTTVWAENATDIDGTDAFPVNDTGRAWTGGVVGDMLVYQHILSGNSNIRLHDLEADAALPNPTVNTPNWEWHPTIGEDSNADTWILFGRQNLSTGVQRILAVNTSESQPPVTLDSTRRRSYSLMPGQVNGNWATWTACKPNCNVWYVDILSGSDAVKVPRTSGVTHQYGGSVTDDGTIYFASSGRGCGSNVRIKRYSAGVTDTITALPDRRDVFFPYVSQEGDGVHLYYDQVNCRSGAWNIFEIVDDGL